MKGLSQTLYLVVVAVVILIVALVLLTIFGSGVGIISGLTQNENLCITKATSTCTSINQMPVDWNSRTLTEEGYTDKVSCKTILSLVNCKDNKLEGLPEIKKTTG